MSQLFSDLQPGPPPSPQNQFQALTITALSQDVNVTRPLSYWVGQGFGNPEDDYYLQIKSANSGSVTLSPNGGKANGVTLGTLNIKLKDVASLYLTFSTAGDQIYFVKGSAPSALTMSVNITNNPTVQVNGQGAPTTPYNGQGLTLTQFQALSPAGPPAGFAWLVVAAHIRILTSATAGTRSVYLLMCIQGTNSGDNDQNPNVLATASVSASSFGDGLYPSPTNAAKFILLQGDTLVPKAVGAQAGDTFNIILEVIQVPIAYVLSTV